MTLSVVFDNIFYRTSKVILDSGTHHAMDVSFGDHIFVCFVLIWSGSSELIVFLFSRASSVLSGIGLPNPRDL